MNIFQYFVYAGVFLITLYFLSFNNNRLRFLFKAILFTSIIFTAFLVIYGFINFQAEFEGERIKLLFDRVKVSEIIISLSGFPAAYLIMNLEKKKYNYWAAGLSALTLILQIALLLYLKTRASWIAFIIMLFFVFFMSVKIHGKTAVIRKMSLIFAIIIIISSVLYFSIKSNYDLERNSAGSTFASIFDKDYYTNKSRLEFWNASLKMFAENPVCGIGYGNWCGLFPKYAGRLFTDATVGMNAAVNPHNDYLEILAEGGIITFLVFTGIIFTGVFQLYRKSKEDSTTLPFFLTAIVLCITMLFSFTKENVWAFTVFAVCMAAGYSAITESFLSKHRKFNFVLLAAGIALLISGLQYEFFRYRNEKIYTEAMQLKGKGLYKEMLEKLDSVSDFYYWIDMNKMPVDFYRGVGYFELKEYKKALEKFRSARKEAEFYPVIMSNEAGALYMSGKSNEAEAGYNEIKILFPDYIEPQINLLALYTNTGKKDKAGNLLQELERKQLNPKYIKNYSVFLQIKDYLRNN